MNYFKLLSLMLFFSLAACQKENIKEIIENPPVIVPDTILQNNAGSFSLGTRQLALDTAYCTTVIAFDPSGNLFNFTYILDTGIDAFESPLGLRFDPPTNTETKIQSTTYSGLEASVASPATIELINNWILQGEDPNTLPFGGMIPTDNYNAMNVSITVSNLVYSISVEDLGGGVKLFKDRGTVELSGSIEDLQGNVVPISGKFVCIFEHYEM